MNPDHTGVWTGSSDFSYSNKLTMDFKYFSNPKKMELMETFLFILS